MSKNVEIKITNSGLAAIWERGGSLTSSGSATLVAGPHGERLKPLAVRTRGDLACGGHALVPVAVGCLVAQANHSREAGETVVSRIVGFEAVEGPRPEIDKVGELTLEAVLRPVEVTPALAPFAAAAAAKARDYHCRRAYWVGEEPIRAAKQEVTQAFAAGRAAAEADIRARSVASAATGMRARLEAIRPRYEAACLARYGSEPGKWEFRHDMWRQEKTYLDLNATPAWDSWKWYGDRDLWLFESLASQCEIHVALKRDVVEPALQYAGTLGLEGISIRIEIQFESWSSDITRVYLEVFADVGEGWSTPCCSLHELDLESVKSEIERVIPLAREELAYRAQLKARDEK